MRFVDFLRAAVLLCAGSATALATLTVVSSSRTEDNALVLFIIVWWVVAAMIGLWLGRRAETNSPIARLLASAKSSNSLPEQRPSSLLLNRLWPLLLSAIGAAALSFVEPQVSSVAAGFTIIWALAWRTQERAVLAIEERDGVRFYVDRTSPLEPIQLIRTPGFGGDFLVRPTS
jgi:hypothetical protein